MPVIASICGRRCPSLALGCSLASSELTWTTIPHSFKLSSKRAIPHQEIIKHHAVAFAWQLGRKLRRGVLSKTIGIIGTLMDARVLSPQSHSVPALNHSSQTTTTH